MARGYYRRPADYQVRTIYRCLDCGHEDERDSCYGAPPVCPFCGGNYVASGESYPADPAEWDESRDDVNGEWHNENRSARNR